MELKKETFARATLLGFKKYKKSVIDPIVIGKELFLEMLQNLY